MTTNKCDICVTDKVQCDKCRDNPKYRDVPRTSMFTKYKPVCPFGMADCVCDPGYIKHYYPDWYKDLYGDMTPEQAAEQRCKPQGSPHDCYDDEDK